MSFAGKEGWRFMLRGFFSFCLLASILVYLSWDGGDLFRSHDSEGELRRQFHIPQGIEIANVHRTGREHCWGGGIITGQVEFSEPAYLAYLAGLSDPSIWRPTPLHHFSDDPRDYHFSDDALSWQSFDPVSRGQTVPSYVNDAHLPRTAGPGWLLCYAIRTPTKDLVGTPEGTGYSGIVVDRCAPAYSESPRAWVLGSLDHGRRTLRMRIQLANPPQYCTKARRRPFLLD
jgi:hypothetical protein